MTARPRPILVVAAVTVAVAAVLGACGDGSDEDAARSIDVDGERVAAAVLEDAVRGLCEARDQARTDVKAAEATFYDHSHEPLHTLARALDPVDRAQAARLLEDKQRVEAGFESSRDAGDMAADLDRLARVTRQGLTTLGVGTRECG